MGRCVQRVKKIGQGGQGGRLVRSKGGLIPWWWMRGGGVQGTDSSEYKFTQVEFLGQDF